MASILLVTPDTKAQKQIEELCTKIGLRLKTVTDFKSASEWLALAHYNFFLIDSRLPSDAPLSLLRQGWGQNPLMAGALFNPAGKVEDEWSARLLGARVFSGQDGLLNLEMSLQTVRDSISSSKLGVLVVEDLDSPREIISSYIEAMGYTDVVGVSNAADAIRELEKNPGRFFSVIADIHMPNVSGISLVARLRVHPELELLPVIMLTADPSVDNLIECVRVGATGFLAKPPRKKQLMDELHKAERIFFSRQNPRVCQPEEAILLEDAITRMLK